MNFLFIHGNYPSQFRVLAQQLSSQDHHNVVFLTARKDWERAKIKNLRVANYDDIDRSILNQSEPYTTSEEVLKRSFVIQQAIYNLCQDNFIPDIIIYHGGNGLGASIRQILPKTILIGYFEWYFTDSCAKNLLGRSDLYARNMISTRNMITNHEILSCDKAVVPTEWQKSKFPIEIREKLQVIFDGVDSSFFTPPSSKIFETDVMITGEEQSVQVNRDDLLLTYMTRGMEPLRGFPEFMRTLPNLLEEFSNLKVIIGGRDRSAYGPSAPSHNGSWKDKSIEELGDYKGKNRVHFIGLAAYGEYKKALQRSNLHCYLTRPYVTSWSLFEAAACGTPLICNRNLATLGTIDIPDKYLISSIDMIYNDEGLQKMKAILRGNHARKSYLNSKFYLQSCLKDWQNLINLEIQKKRVIEQ